MSQMRRTGTVTMYHSQSDFGLIKLDSFGPRIVIRRQDLCNGCTAQVNEGDRVEFDIERDDRHILIAVNVRQIA